MNAKRIVIISVVGGVVIALLTGLVSNTPMLVGAVWYGYPLAWLIRMVVAPEYFPWKVEVVGLIADIVVWTLIVLVILLVAMRKRKSPAGAGPKATQ